MTNSARRVGLLLVGVLALCFCVSPHGSGLERELIERSSRGLALGSIRSQGDLSLHVRFFDGRTDVRRLDCCSTTVFAVSEGYIVGLESASSREPLDLIKGGSLVLLDLSGKLVARSELKIISPVADLAPDRDRFVFLGSPGGTMHPYEEWGLYVARLSGATAQKLLAVEPQHATRDTPQPPVSTLNWAPDEATIAYSNGKQVTLLEADTGLVREVFEGDGAHWSPKGKALTYLTKDSEIVMLDLRSGKRTGILPGRKMLRSPLWSPDGEYLLVEERHGSVMPCLGYGRIGVYRLTDHAFVPIPCYGVVGGATYWVRS